MTILDKASTTRVSLDFQASFSQQKAQSKEHKVVFFLVFNFSKQFSSAVIFFNRKKQQSWMMQKNCINFEILLIFALPIVHCLWFSLAASRATRLSLTSLDRPYCFLYVSGFAHLWLHTGGRQEFGQMMDPAENSFLWRLYFLLSHLDN